MGLMLGLVVCLDVSEKRNATREVLFLLVYQFGQQVPPSVEVRRYRKNMPA